MYKLLYSIYLIPVKAHCELHMGNTCDKGEDIIILMLFLLLTSGNSDIKYIFHQENSKKKKKKRQKKDYFNTWAIFG